MMLRSTLFSALAIAVVVIWAGGARANLVANGGFETETPTGCQTGANGACTLPPPDWQVPNGGVGVDTVFPNTGTYDAVFTSSDPTSGILSQPIATTAGASYDLDFAVVDQAGFSGDSFTASFGGFSVTITGDQASPFQNGVDLYTAESFAIPGADITGSSTSLSFQGLNDPVIGIDWNLDDVTLACTANCTAPVPEPPTLPLLLGALAGWVAIRRLC